MIGETDHKVLPNNTHARDVANAPLLVGTFVPCLISSREDAVPPAPPRGFHEPRRCCREGLPPGRISATIKGQLAR